ncbi:METALLOPROTEASE 1-RELATED protein, putative [Babesia bigemina]|uniref:METALLOPROTEASE 1-RELATED protein, putative n=1 Tax=Babesia bigemina TaxID=5866 RepID=A0A061D1N7_BABBI|nr:METALLOPROTEASE 1-RELATED protein, putative [Babesia bigemina]CDR94563.1 METALLOPROTEASE 1-RELATED protein, putative [Babesia bigemina]|eukprot:XP_012766749.1 METALLOPROTEASE 1-RELATED protein, putative [Babesia bigemina]
MTKFNLEGSDHASRVKNVIIQGFALVNLITVKHVEVSEYVSERTGLRVFFMHYESPIVNSYFIVPTRAESHEGLPHTLEHLIFLGSASYPERGTLDLLASRALAAGTNAWTDVDHTVYTISTAGVDGTLMMLPVYLDHLLRPTLTQEAFMTDVHRITPDGSNSGTVYSEMKDNEHDADSVTEFELNQLLYPGGSGYSMSFGGRLESLRSTNVERVREYHKRYYRLDNMSIAIGGSLNDGERILQAVSKAEEALLAAGVEANAVKSAYYFGIKQWDDPVHCQPLKETVEKTVYFPSDDEELGQFTMAWRGPAWSDFQEIRALSIMGLYLTQTPISPMEKELVYTRDPFGSGVGFAMDEYKETRLNITVLDVPCGEKMEQIAQKMRDIITSVWESPLDMERLQAIIRRERLSYFRSLETQASNIMIEGIVSYVVYGEKRKDLDEQLEGDDQMGRLLLEDEPFWKGILEKYLIHAPWVGIRTVPSIKESKRIEREERQLVREQLKKSDMKLLEAQEALVNSIVSNKGGGVPKHVLDAFGVAAVENVALPQWPYMRNFNSVGPDADGGRAMTGRVQLFNVHGHRTVEHIWSDLTRQLDEVKISMQVNHVTSDFVRFTVLIPTMDLGLTHLEKQCLTLLTNLLFQSHLREGRGPPMSSDAFIMELQETTSSYSASLGLASSFGSADAYSEMVRISLTCHIGLYERVFGILQRVLQDVQFTDDIVDAKVKSLLKSFHEKSRSAKANMRQAVQAMRMKRDSVRMSNGIAQQLALLRDAEEGETAALLQSLYDKVFAQRNIVAHVTCDVRFMPKSWLGLWAQLPASGATGDNLRDMIGFKFATDVELSDQRTMYMSMASTDVSFFNHAIRAPIGFGHSEYAPLSMLCEYLCMLESPLFRAIRGGGYAYDYAVSYLPSVGEMHLSLLQAVDVVGALRATRDVFGLIRRGNLPTEDDVISARCSLVFNIVQSEESLSAYSCQTFQDAFRGVDSKFTVTLLNSIRDVTPADFRRLAETYLSHFLHFDDPWSTAAVVTNKSQADDIYHGLVDLGYDRLRRVSTKAMMNFATTGSLESADADSDDEMGNDIDNDGDDEMPHPSASRESDGSDDYSELEYDGEIYDSRDDEDDDDGDDDDEEEDESLSGDEGDDAGEADEGGDEGNMGNYNYFKP